MEFAYKKLLEEHNLTVAELPSDAQIGIKTIEQAWRMIEVRRKSKQPASPGAVEKIKANDKWVVREILDFVHEKDSNNGELPNDKDDIIEEFENAGTVIPNANEQVEEDEQLGIAIDAELSAQHKGGKTELTINEIKSGCPRCYDVIFKNYEKGQANGIQTTKYSLIEQTDKPETYKLTAL